MTTATGEFSIAALSRSGIQPCFPVAARVMRRKDAPRKEMLTWEPRTVPFELEFANGERIKVELVGSGHEPTSFWHVLTRIEHLSKLPSGWDSYGSHPLNPRAVRRAFELFSVLLTENTPEPSVIPTRDGGLQFEWHRKGTDLEVTCDPAGSVSYYYADEETGKEHEGGNGAARQVIHDVLQRLTQPA